jgi:adenosylcobinamide-GDP ribazoletransferase
VRTLSLAHRLTREAYVFFNAWVFFTRMPAPTWVRFTPRYQRLSNRYYPLVGIFVGLVAVVAYVLAEHLFPVPLAVLFSMLATVLVTGAFHEDGLADTCDAFGGGWGKDHILRIMKDSRIGTYGVVGLGFALAVKFAALNTLASAPYFLAALVAGHSVSRFASMSLLSSYPYVQLSDVSKSQMQASRPSLGSLAIGAASAGLPLVVLAQYADFAHLLFVLLAVAGMRWWLGRYSSRLMGGVTGDVMGALQQMSEVVFYLALLVQW